MNISLDAGALCIPEHTFGTATVTRNLIEALGKHDPQNRYFAYVFSGRATIPKAQNVKVQKLLPKQAWMNGAVSVEETFRPKDIFLAINQAIPAMTRARIFSFSHGLSFLKYPEYYSESFDSLKQQTEQMARRSEKIFVSSTRVRDEFVEYFKHTPEIVVLPFGVPYDMMTRQISNPKGYCMYVGMDAGIKDISFIIKNVEQAQKKHKHLKLYLVGNFDEKKKYGPNIIAIKPRSREELRNLYLGANAVLSASHYESFNFPAVEALSLGCPVIATQGAITPELTPFVHAARENEYAELIELAMERQLPKVKQEKIHHLFSWQTYVKELKTHY